MSAGTRWRLGAVRVFAYALAAVQVAQGLTYRDTRQAVLVAGTVKLDAFSRSYWIVNYEHGFVRRGLGGEILRWFTGTPSAGDIDVVFAIIVVSSVLALLAVVELLLRTRRDGCAALALLLAASPFGFDYLTWEHRPDQLGVPLLVLLGFGVAKGSARARPWFVTGIGLAFGVLTLVHEGAALIVLPWALVVLAVRSASSTSAPSATTGVASAASRTWSEVALLLGPAAVALAAVIAFGRASPGVVAQFQHDSPAFVGQVNGFTTLGHSFSEAWATVQFVPDEILIASFVTGAVLVALQLAWVRGWAHVRVVSALAQVRPRPLGALAIAAAVGATVALFVTGVDWLRWFAAVGCSWLVATAFVAVGTPEPPVPDPSVADPTVPDRGVANRTDRRTRRTVSVPNLLPVAAVLLTVLLPLPESTSAADLHRLLPWFG